MFTEIRSALRPALVMLTGFTLLLGVLYPLAVTGIAGVVLPVKAGGSIITANGKAIGSELIGQDFTGTGYFHPRLSAAGKGYDASASSGANLGPGSKDLADRIAASIKTLRDEGVAGALPADLLTTSASGLDPDISPEAAAVQVARVARARGLADADVEAFVATQTRGALLGLIGEPRVNVLALNRALDARAKG